MTLLVRISEEAEAEIAEATRWYETHRAGLGTEFLSAIDGAAMRIAEALDDPDTWSVGFPPDVRRAE